MTSISMLRQHSQLPIIALLIDSTPEPTFLDFCNRHHVNIMLRNWHILDSSIFPSNKIYLKDIQADSVLFLDCDTLIFGDVNPIFEAHQEDFVACENDWAYGQKYQLSFLPHGMKPYNSGVMLFNGGSHLNIFNNFESNYLELKTGGTPLGQWLVESGNRWTIDEFTISQVVARLNLRNEYFKREHCHNIKWQQDFERMRESIVFHTYTRQWKEAVRLLKKPRHRPPVYRFVPF